MSLHQLPPDARPREKLLARGAAALSDSELLALLLRTGTAGRGVLHMAADVLAVFGGLSGLLNAGADALKRVKGLGGPAKRGHDSIPIPAFSLKGEASGYSALPPFFSGKMARRSGVGVCGACWSCHAGNQAETALISNFVER
jgi:hypothetical protein